MSWRAVIGLEVHAQLATRSKLFCACATGFGAPANSQTCEVCLGLPGALPVVNRGAVELAVRVAVALGCEVHRRSGWARKHYLYPDLAKGYQITQHQRPLATGGRLPVGDDSFAISRVHLEEDAGKTDHDQVTSVDFNRGGVPLVEIVGAPELSSGAQAAAYLKALRHLLRVIGACDGNMERGNLRCDANVSLRPADSDALGARTELKNLNSFRFVQQAVDQEVARQIERVEAGGTVATQTRAWDPRSRTSSVLRAKEEARDYRTFPEPDLPDLVLDDGLVEGVRRSLPELPAARRARFVRLGLSDYDAGVLVGEPEVADFFEATLAVHDNPKAAANWVSNELLRALKDRELNDLPVTPERLAALIALVDHGVISTSAAKTVFAEMTSTGGESAAIVEARGLRRVGDDESLAPVVERVIAANPEAVAAVRAGRERALGPLVGQVIAATGGQADPRRVRALLRERIDRGE